MLEELDAGVRAFFRFFCSTSYFDLRIGIWMGKAWLLGKLNENFRSMAQEILILHFFSEGLVDIIRFFDSIIY